MITNHFKNDPEERREVFNRLFAEYITLMENKKFV